MSNDYLERRRNIKLFGQAPKEKKTTSIPKQSEKTKELNKEYKKKVLEFLLKHPKCQIKSPSCTKKATTVHHTKRRGVNLMNEKDWKASCWPCNSWVESHDKEAREQGHLKSVHKIEK